MYIVMRLPPLRPSFDWGSFVSSTPWLGECCFKCEIIIKNRLTSPSCQGLDRAAQGGNEKGKPGPEGPVQEDYYFDSFNVLN